MQHYWLQNIYWFPLDDINFFNLNFICMALVLHNLKKTKLLYVKTDIHKTVNGIINAPSFVYILVRGGKKYIVNNFFLSDSLDQFFQRWK